MLLAVAKGQPNTGKRPPVGPGAIRLKQNGLGGIWKSENDGRAAM
ncbi:MAG: hypothetical protein QOI34_664 [Verrucomicrobiota bacterium]|jgi:hypothetical protein